MSQGGYSKVIHQPSGSSTTTQKNHFAQQPRASSRRRRPCVCGAFSFCGRRGHPQTPLGGHPSPCTASPSPPRGHVHETMTGRGGATTGVLVLAAGRWGWATRGASIVRSHKTTHPSFCVGRFRAVLRWHSGRKKGPNARTKRALYRHAVARWGLRRGLRPAVRKAACRPGVHNFLQLLSPTAQARPPPPPPPPPTAIVADRRPPTADRRPSPAARPSALSSAQVESSRVESRALLHTDRDSPPLATSPWSPSATSRSLA